MTTPYPGRSQASKAHKIFGRSLPWLFHYRSIFQSNATDYAIHLGKRTADKSLSVKWFKGVNKCWPEIRVVKPRSLTQCRARCTSGEAISSNFNNLETVLKSNDLYEKPECIFNIDEIGIQTEHYECPCHRPHPQSILSSVVAMHWGHRSHHSLFSKVCLKL